MNQPLIPKLESLSASQRALIFYHNKLAEKFAGRFLTPAMLVELNNEIKLLQQFQARNETHPVWQLPVKVITDPRNQLNWLVVEDK